MKKQKPKTLPNKPSALIRLALADLAKVERSKRYVVDMWRWHAPYLYQSKCGVCFAGAVMACTLKTLIQKSVGPSSLIFTKSPSRKFFALDYFRKGDVKEGLWVMGLQLPRGMRQKWTIESYSFSPVVFRNDMTQLAADLQKAGL